MTHRRCLAVALLSALPVETGNLFLIGMMLDPGPSSAGILHKLLGAEWLFFHFIGFRVVDPVSRTFGTEKVGLVVAFLLAYLQPLWCSLSSSKQSGIFAFDQIDAIAPIHTFPSLVSATFMLPSE